jgi:hypothetical protein
MRPINWLLQRGCRPCLRVDEHEATDSSLRQSYVPTPGPLGNPARKYHRRHNRIPDKD